MVESTIHHKSRAVGVSSEVGLTTCSMPVHKKKTTCFIPPRHRKSCGTSHYSTIPHVSMVIFSYYYSSICKFFSLVLTEGFLVVLFFLLKSE